jgi:hypothetical protein
VYETEPNDNAGDANALVGHVCGHVAGADRDDFTFTLGAGVTMFSFNYSGGVTVTANVDGQTVTLGPGVPIPFVPNKAYTIEVQSTDGSDVDYTLDLGIGP